MGLGLAGAARGKRRLARENIGAVNAVRPREVIRPVIGEPALDLKIHVHGAFPAGTDADEESAVVGCQGCDTRLAAPCRGGVGLREGCQLGSVIVAHGDTMRYDYRVVNGTDTAFKAAACAGIIPHMDKPLAERIDARLKELGLTANGASVLAGGSRDLIRNVKRGRSTTLQGENLLRLAKVLQVPPEFFQSDFRGDAPVPAAVAYPAGLTEKRLKAIADLEELSPEEEESFLEELEAMARAARARRQRGGIARS